MEYIIVLRKIDKRCSNTIINLGNNEKKIWKCHYEYPVLIRKKSSTSINVIKKIKKKEYITPNCERLKL